MSFKIEQGLFSFNNVTDYHAILGISVNAALPSIRKKSLQLIRQLHPDSTPFTADTDRKRAEDFLSKLVNPAYQKLVDDKTYREQLTLLKLLAQQAQKQQETVLLIGMPARELAASKDDLDATYQRILQSLADEQYSQLDKTLELIGQISELNLVYLMRKEGNGVASPTGMSTSKPAPSQTTGPAASRTPVSRPSAPPKVPASPVDMAEPYIRRAKEFERRGDYTKALMELREALKIDGKNVQVLAYSGQLYIKTNIPTMAKVNFKKALDLDPRNQVALEGLKQVDPAAAKAAQDQQQSGSAKAATKDNKTSGGGLFGLFGGNKTGGNRK